MVRLPARYQQARGEATRDLVRIPRIVMRCTHDGRRATREPAVPAGFSRSGHVLPARATDGPAHNPRMDLFGIAGHSGMGKTTLLTRLVPALAARGRRVSLIKHSHKDIEIDRPGKDSWRLREAGCHEVLLLGASRWALMRELRGVPEPSLDELLPRLEGGDDALVLVEGFKSGDFPKLEVWRAQVGKPPLAPGWPGILAIATDATDAAESPVPGLPHLALDDVDRVADFVLAHARRVDARP
jgi:molybdopterin-guanine dinucleotide biosynthesis protein B